MFAIPTVASNDLVLGPVYTTVEKASGRSRMLGQDMVNRLYEANGGCAGEELKAIQYFLLSWASPEEEFLVWPLEAGETQLQKVPPRRRPCHFIIHEKSSPPLFSSPSVNTHRSRVAFSTNHN